MKALKWQILYRLISDSEYLTLMGFTGESPYNGFDGQACNTYWYKPPVNPTFPETVLNISAGRNDTSLGDGLLSGVYSLGINVWSKNDAFEDIIKRIIQLMNQKPETGTTGFYAVYTGESEDMIDDTFAVYGKRVTFDVYYRRATYE